MAMHRKILMNGQLQLTKTDTQKNSKLVDISLKIESLTKILPIKTSPGPNASTNKFY